MVSHDMVHMIWYSHKNIKAMEWRLPKKEVNVHWGFLQETTISLSLGLFLMGGVWHLTGHGRSFGHHHVWTTTRSPDILYFFLIFFVCVFGLVFFFMLLFHFGLFFASLCVLFFS